MAGAASVGVTDRTVTSGTSSKDGRPMEHRSMLKNKETVTSDKKVPICQTHNSFDTFDVHASSRIPCCWTGYRCKIVKPSKTT